MCGRFFLISQGTEVAQFFGLKENPDLEPRYNIAPTQDVAVVRQETQDCCTRTLSYMRWGLVPIWTKELSRTQKLINARCETLHEKPAFRAAFRSRRCALPANGFFEWEKKGQQKQPYAIQLSGGRLFALAGLWDRWQNIDGRTIESCTIITTEANEIVSRLHNRMPVILDHHDVDLWLDTNPGAQELWKKLFRPFPANEMFCHPVTTRMSNPTYDAPDCIQSLQVFQNNVEQYL